MPGKTVYVELIAQTKKFNAGLKKADKGLAKTRKAVGLVSAAILAIGTVALRAVAREMNEISRELDEMAKTARALNADFSFFEDLQFVFKRLGATGGIGTLKKTMLAVSKATGEALTGSAEYVDEFKALNLNVKEFAKLDPEARILALQDAYSRSAQGAKEQNALQIIAGRGAKALLNFFATGTEEIDRLIAKRRELGGFDDTAAGLAETFEDVKTNVEQVKRGLKSEVFKALAPTFIAGAKALQRFATNLRETGMTGTFVKGVVTAITIAMGAASVAAIALVATLSPIAVTAGVVALALGGIGVGLFTLVTRWDELTESIKFFAQHFNSLRDNFVTGFGGEVLKLFGFGNDDTAAQNAGRLAPTTVSGATTNNNSNATIVNHNYASGSTPEQQRAERRRQEQAQLRGKRK